VVLAVEDDRRGARRQGAGQQVERVGRVAGEDHLVAGAAAEEVGEHMMKQIRVFRELLAQTPVDQLEVREEPAVLFRVNSNTWLDAIVRYLVLPREAGRVKSRLIKKLLAELNAAPERVSFPKSNMR